MSGWIGSSIKTVFVVSKRPLDVSTSLFRGTTRSNAWVDPVGPAR